MAILPKGCKADDFEPHNFLKLSFTNIWGLHSNFVECESFHEKNSPNILAVCETNLDDSVDSGNLSVRGFFFIGICKAKQPLQGMELRGKRKKKHKKIKACKKFV